MHAYKLSTAKQFELIPIYKRFERKKEINAKQPNSCARIDLNKSLQSTLVEHANFSCLFIGKQPSLLTKNN